MKSTISDPKPVRRIRPSHRSITGKFASQKTQTIHYFESTLERDYLTLLEFDPAVKSYYAQPLTLNYEHEGKERRYTPDVLVNFQDYLNKNPLLCEIKYEAELELKRAELQPKFEAAINYAGECNYEFKVITEKQIRTDYLHNIKFLSQYRHYAVDETTAQPIIALFKGTDSITAKALLTGYNVQENGRILHAVWQMLSAEILACDMHHKITMTTELWINNKSRMGL